MSAPFERLLRLTLVSGWTVHFTRDDGNVSNALVFESTSPDRATGSPTRILMPPYDFNAFFAFADSAYAVHLMPTLVLSSAWRVSFQAGHGAAFVLRRSTDEPILELSPIEVKVINEFTRARVQSN